MNGPASTSPGGSLRTVQPGPGAVKVRYVCDGPVGTSQPGTLLIESVLDAMRSAGARPPIPMTWPTVDPSPLLPSCPRNTCTTAPVWTPTTMLTFIGDHTMTGVRIAEHKAGRARAPTLVRESVREIATVAITMRPAEACAVVMALRGPIRNRELVAMQAGVPVRFLRLCRDVMARGRHLISRLEDHRLFMAVALRPTEVWQEFTAGSLTRVDPWVWLPLLADPRVMTEVGGDPSNDHWQAEVLGTIRGWDRRLGTGASWVGAGYRLAEAEQMLAQCRDPAETQALLKRVRAQSALAQGVV